MTLLPQTTLGRWAVWLLVGSVVALAAFFGAANLGVTGGETLLDQPIDAWLFLFVPILCTAVLGVAGGAAAVLAVLRVHERSILLALPVLWATIVVLFALGEFVAPH